MQRLRPLFFSPLLLCAALTACSSGGSDQAAVTPSASAAPSSAAAPAPTASAAVTSAPAPAPSEVATSSVAPSSAAPAGGAAGTITFTGKFSGRMTVRDCQGGIAQLDVDIDGQPTTYAGIIDAQDFTFVAPKSAGFTLAKGAANPTVSNGGKTFTVHATKLIGILNDDTVIATGSITCP